MSYSVSGDLITQSGTNTNYSGLEAISGVTTFSSNGRVIYQLNNKRMRINGTQTQDPELEELLFIGYGNSITFDVRGTFNLGQEVNIGAILNRFSSGTAMRFTRNTDSNYQESNSDFYVSSSGTFNWYGGSMFSRRIFANYGNMNTFSKNCEWINQSTAVTQMRQRSSGFNVNGLVTRGCFLTLIANATQINNWSPYEPAGGNQVVGLSSSTPSNTWLRLDNLDSRGVAGQVLSFWSNKWGRMVNNFTGSNVAAGGNADNDNANRGIYEIRQELTLNYSDLSGSSLDDVSVFMKDTNGGIRLAANSIGSNPSYTADRSYTGVSSSGAVTFDTDGGVLVAVIYRNSESLRALGNDYDFRSLSGTNSDDFKFISAKYGFAIKQSNLILKGSESTARTVTMLPDFSITESNVVSVNAYTLIDTTQKLYDRAMSYLAANNTGIASSLVTRSGNATDAGAYNVNIDATAGVAFAISGNTITIKANTFVGDMVTTGVITLLNGATFTGTRTDANGTVAPLLFLTVTSNISLVGAEVRMYDADSTGVNKGTELTGVETSASATFTTSLIANANLIFIQIIQAGVEEEEISFTMGATSQTINISRRPEEND